MEPNLRKAFNEAFTKQQYEHYLTELKSYFPGDIEFRVAETPIFIGKKFTQKLLDACESIVDIIVQPNFLTLTENAFPPGVKVPNETSYSDFIAFDFGICEDENGELSPQLIEMQGFPTLFAYQILHDEITRKHFNIPENYSSYLSNLQKDTYIKLLKEVIIGSHNAENVILLEIYPENQKTRIDFSCTNAHLGIEVVCLTKLISIDNQLFYEKNEQLVQVKRIYNRIIFDELDKQELPANTVDIRQQYDVEWVPHPNWFYRISKYTLPFINSPYVPETRFLHNLESIPTDLENYVLKPLFSFAGQGVVIDVSPKDIEDISDSDNWILQKKVKYAEVITTPDIPAKAEIRIFYFWPKNASRPIATQNLARLSKGKMIGVRYNADKEWVGGSLCFFEQ